MLKEHFNDAQTCKDLQRRTFVNMDTSGNSRKPTDAAKFHVYQQTPNYCKPAPLKTL